MVNRTLFGVPAFFISAALSTQLAAQNEVPTSMSAFKPH